VHDLTLIAAMTTASCLAVGLLGLVLLRLVRGASLVLTLVPVVLVPVLSVAVSVVVSVRAMFLSAHDSAVVLWTLACGLLIALVLAVVVARDVVTGTRELTLQLRRLGSSGGRPVRPDSEARLPAELAALWAELQATRQRLEESARRERALEAGRRELIAFLSHDLRTPLTQLRALAEGMEDGVVTDVPVGLARIRGVTDRMATMVRDLFELSQVTGPGRERSLRQVGLAELAADVVGEAASAARSEGVDLRLELDGTDRLPVLGDSDELGRALANLVANAVRHTDRGGSVRVQGGRGEDGRVRLAVVDGCGGIPSEELPKVFDVGWRGAPERTPDDGGAGLGLAIARGVIESHRGSIEVGNVPGGCRFELALPGTD
jgi:signal transduction histidine kinase